MGLGRTKTIERVIEKVHVCYFTDDITDTERKQKEFIPKKVVLMKKFISSSLDLPFFTSHKQSFITMYLSVSLQSSGFFNLFKLGQCIFALFFGGNVILSTTNYKINVHKCSDFNYSHHKFRLIILDHHYSIYINLTNGYLSKHFLIISLIFIYTITLFHNKCIPQLF